MPEYVTTIKADDVGRTHLLRPDCFCCGAHRNIYIQDVMGRVLPSDVGKKLYRVRSDANDRWVLQVENDAQRDARMGNPFVDTMNKEEGQQTTEEEVNVKLQALGSALLQRANERGD